MSLFRADYKVRNILCITPEMIRESGAKVLLLDADNTLSFHGSAKPFPGVAEWVDEMKKNGIGLIIISNNSKKRIAPFAEKLGIPYIAKSAKPLKKGFLAGCGKFGAKPSEAAVIGDQVFTDVVGGNLIGAKVFLTKPLGPETDRFLKIKRKLEVFFR